MPLLVYIPYARESRCRRVFARLYKISCKYTVSLIYIHIYIHKYILIIRVRLDSFENENSSEDTWRSAMSARICASSVGFEKRQQLYARTDAGWKSAKITCTRHTPTRLHVNSQTFYTHTHTHTSVHIVRAPGPGKMMKLAVERPRAPFHTDMYIFKYTIYVYWT